MQRIMCKSKIHRATVTQADLNYMGSITLDKQLMDEADIQPYEQVHVVNVTNGNRFITYAISGTAGSGVVCVNGAAARLVAPQDIVIIMSYAHYAENEMEQFNPKVVFVDDHNKMVETRLGEAELEVYA
jgi:aspartate 1-decarboxylase